jgi:hypothetical protein
MGIAVSTTVLFVLFCPWVALLPRALSSAPPERATSP